MLSCARSRLGIQLARVSTSRAFEAAWSPARCSTAAALTRQCSGGLPPRDQFQTTCADVEAMLRSAYGSIQLSPRDRSTIKCLTSGQDGRLSSFWITAIRASPSVLTVNGNSLLAAADLLASLDVEDEDAAAFIGACPPSVLQDPQEFGSLIDSWQSFTGKMGVSWMLPLLHVPDLLLIQPEEWTFRKSELMEYFHTKDDLRNVIESSPFVLVEKWDSLKEKITFLLDVMHVSIKDIARSGALSHDLDFIKVRYAFVDRCGFYKHPAKSLGLTAKAEPPIDSLLIPKERAFLKKTLKGTVTLEEYNVFLSAYQAEIEGDEHVDAHEHSISYAIGDDDEDDRDFHQIPDSSESGKRRKGKGR